MFEQSSTARLSCEENRCVCEKVLTLGHSIGTGSTLWHHMHWGTCAVQLSGSIVTNIMEEAVMKVVYDQHLHLSVQMFTHNSTTHATCCNFVKEPIIGPGQPTLLHRTLSHVILKRVHKTHARCKALTTDCSNQ